jgi:hypothetical protein
VLVLVVVAFGWIAAEHVRGRNVAAKRRVVVNLLDDRAMTGILWRRHRHVVVLRGVELVEVGREPVAVDGAVVIERDRIAFTQGGP